MEKTTVMRRNERQRKKLAGFTILLFMTAIAGSSCSIQKLVADGQGNDMLDADDAVLNCSAECLDRGQCGADEGGTNYVLLASRAPSLTGHDTAAESKTPISILNRENHSVRQIKDGTTFDMSFYRVALPDDNDAWVAGWCLKN